MIFLKSLNSSHITTKKAEVMTVNFSNMTKIQKYQHFLRRRFQEVENLYYPIVDDLTQKVADLTGNIKHPMPDLTLNQFTFIKDWQYGDLSSSEVAQILKTFKIDDVAKAQLTRRLNNYLLIEKNELVRSYVAPCINLITTNVAEKYESYLRLLINYFDKLVEIDKNQEQITWIEQFYDLDSSVRNRINDMPFNQAIFQLENQVIPYNGTKYYIGDNIVCLNEEAGQGAYAMHYIFAPKCYIDELKDRFKIAERMEFSKESTYLKRLIGVYVK